MSNNDLQSILARHNLKGINVANFSQPRAHQPTPSRPQPYQYPAPVPQPQQVYQYPAVARQQWIPPAEAARQQVRPSFAWPSAPQPQYTIDPRHYSYNIWGKAPVYSLTGEDEEENEESEDEGEGEAEGGDDGIAVEDVDADAGTKVEESIDAEKAETQHIVTDEPTEKTNIIPPAEPSPEDSATPVAEEIAAEPAKEESAPEPPSEDPPSEPIQAEAQPAVAEEPPIAPSPEEGAADSSATTSQEPDPVPEACQDSAVPAPAEEAPVAEPAAEDAVSSESADSDAPASEDNIEVVDVLAEEKDSEEPAIAAVLQDDEDSTADTVATVEATGKPDSEEEAVPGANTIEDAAEAPKPTGDTLTVDDPPEDSPSQDSSTEDLPPVDSPEKDTAEEVPPSAEPSPADQDAETISEPESQIDVTPAPESDSVAVEEPPIEAVEQQPPATEIEDQPVEAVEAVDSANSNDESAVIVIDVGGEETTSDNTVVIVDVPPSTSDETIDAPPPPPPAPHVTIAEPMKPSKVSSKKKSSKSSKSRQPEKTKEVKPVKIIPLKVGRPRTTIKSKGKAKKSRGKVVEKAMKACEDSPPPPPLVVAVPEDAVIDVPPPAPSPPPPGCVIEVAGVEAMQVIDVVDENKDIEETAAEAETSSPEVESIAPSEEEAAGHQEQDTVVESSKLCSSELEPAAEAISTSPSDEPSLKAEQADSIAVELPEAVQEVAVSAEPPVKDLAPADAITDETVAKDAIDGDAVETMSPAEPHSRSISPTADASESIVDEPCASVQAAAIGDDPATIEEGLAETSGETAPAEATEIDGFDSAVETTVESIAMEESSASDDTAAISVEPVAEDPELVAESAAAPVESIELVTSEESVLESKAEVPAAAVVEESPINVGESSEESASTGDIPDVEPNTDDAHNGVLVVTVHPEVEESIDTDVEILPEAPMPPGSQLLESEGESGGEDEDGGEEQQNMSGEPTTEPIDREEPEEFPGPQAADAVEMEATDLPNPVEEDPMSVLDSSTAKPEAEKVEASDQSEPVAATPGDREDATRVSPIETPDAAVDIPPADQDALSAHATQESETSSSSNTDHPSEVVAIKSDDQVHGDSKVEQEPIHVETSEAPESEAKDASPPAEEEEAPKIIDTPQAPPDQKLEGEATEHVEKAVDPDVAEDAVDEGEKQEITEPIAEHESEEDTGATEEPAPMEQEAVVVDEAGAPERLPIKHDATTSDGTSQPTVQERAAQDPAVDGAIIEEPAAELQELVKDAAVDESAADTTEEPVMPESAVKDHALHKEASEPVADDPTGTEPCETITEQSVITDLEISAEDKPPEEVAQTTTDYIPEAPAETTVEDPEEANNAASSTEGTVGQEEGGTISNKPSLQVLVEDVQSSSAKALLEERTAPSLPDHGGHQDQDLVPTEPVVEKLLEPDEEPSPRLPSISGAEEDAPEAAEPGPSAPSHGFAAREEESFGPQDSISERDQPMGEPQLGSVYIEHQFVAGMSGALPPKSAAPSGSIPHPPSRVSGRGPPAGPASIHPSKASVHEPVASSSTSKQPSRASPPNDKRRSVYSTRTKVKDISRTTGDPKVPVEITRRTTIKTTPPTNFLGMRSSGSKSSRQPSNIDDLKRQADDLAAREKETRRKIAEAEQRAEIADRARKLREQEAKLAFLHEAEAATAKREERRRREREERESARLRDEEAKLESSRNTEPERAARRHRRRHRDRVSESHRRHRDERPRSRKHSSSHRDEQIREQSPHPEPSSQPHPREPREPKVRRYRAEEIGTERRRTEVEDIGEETYTREQPEPSRRPEERRRRSHRESRKEEKPKGLFGSLKSVFKKL